MSYDADGNLLNDTYHAYTWDSDGKLASVDSVPVTYDALGRMVEENSSTQFLYLAGGQQPLALMNGSTLTLGYVPLPGGSFAIYNSGGIIQYNHSDWLGSARLITTPSQTLSVDKAYAPYGEPYPNGAGWTQFTSAGNTWTASGLDDFMFRRYSPTQGRWISLDPAGMAAADPSNPQTWNRYAYVANNPLSATDPSGLRMRRDGSDQGDDGGGGAGAGFESITDDNGYIYTVDGVPVFPSAAQEVMDLGFGCLGSCSTSLTRNGNTYTFTQTAGGTIAQGPNGEELSDGDIAELFPDGFDAAAGNDPTMYLLPQSDSCDFSGRHINYTLQGRGNNNFYVREALTINGGTTDMVSGATVNAFPDWITYVATSTIVYQTFLGSAGDPRRGHVSSFSLPVQRSIGGWPILLDRQPIERKDSNIFVAGQPCPK